MEQRLRAMLNQHNASYTHARLLVFESLNSSNSPISMSALILKLKGKVDRVTIYRTVDLFVKLHIVTRLQNGWKYKLELSDAFHNHHHHLNCNICGATIKFYETDEIKQEIQKIADRMQFKVVAHTLELIGVCNNCRDIN